MASSAALQMLAGVLKSGSPRLKSKTLMPAAFIWRALAPAAMVADGWTDAANDEMRIIAAGDSGVGGDRHSMTAAGRVKDRHARRTVRPPLPAGPGRGRGLGRPTEPPPGRGRRPRHGVDDDGPRPDRLHPTRPVRAAGRNDARGRGR